MPITLIIETAINGIANGLMYALFAAGLALIWGAMRMLNFAHGEFFMLAGYLMFYFIIKLGLDPILSSLLVMVALYGFGYLVERLAITRLLKSDNWMFATVIVTLGISILMESLALIVFGAGYHNIPYYIEGVTRVMGIRISNQRLLIAGVGVVALIAMGYVLKYTKFGLGLRATSQDSEAASLYGVDYHFVYRVTFAIAAVLAALAALVTAPITAVHPLMGKGMLLAGFVVVVLGGLGSFLGAIIGGILLGLVESFVTLYWAAEWQTVMSFVLLALILIFKPWGIFGVPESK